MNQELWTNIAIMIIAILAMILLPRWVDIWLKAIVYMVAILVAGCATIDAVNSFSRMVWYEQDVVALAVIVSLLIIEFIFIFSPNFFI